MAEKGLMLASTLKSCSAELAGSLGLPGGVRRVTLVHVLVPDKICRAPHDERIPSPVALDVQIGVGRMGEEHFCGGGLRARVRGQTTCK